MPHLTYRRKIPINIRIDSGHQNRLPNEGKEIT